MNTAPETPTLLAPGTRVFHRDYPYRKGTVVATPTTGNAEATRQLLEANPWVMFVREDQFGDAVLPYDRYMWLPIKNTLVTIGCTGNRTAYLNVSVEEATRRFLARENEHVHGDDQKKTVLDECDRVNVLEFADEFPTYD